MSSSLQVQLLTLDRENKVLRQQAQTLKSERDKQTGISLLIRNVQEKAFILPEDMVNVSHVYHLHWAKINTEETLEIYRASIFCGFTCCGNG